AQSERISFYLRKWETQAQPRRGQLWMLQGGPGHGGEDQLWLAAAFAEEGFDVYLIDYRGTGQSAPLACLGEENAYDVSSVCMDEIADRWGERVRFFSTADVATDIGKAIEAERGDDEVFIYGASYGSQVANQLLALFPDLLSGAVIDSICPPSGCRLFHWEHDVNRSAERVFDLCGADPTCSARLSEDPWARLGDLMERVKDGHCREFAGRSTPMAFSMLLAYTVDSRRLAPVALASMYRMERCEPEDIEALRYFIFEPDAEATLSLATDSAFAPFLYWNILLSEFWEDGLLPEAILAELEPLVIRTGFAETAIERRSEWPVPTYRLPDWLRHWADVSTPLLLLNGDLDARTPSWNIEGIREAFSRPHQTYVEVPFGGHGIIAEGEAENQFGTCGYQMILDFLLDPLAEPDTSCLAGLESLDLEGSGDLAEMVFGTSDLWENGVSRIATAREPDPALELEWRRLKDRLKSLRIDRPTSGGDD
ncbi:MAG TPA: alpha/beta fold hydrolase, partial [Vulgatibacter sp.]